MRRSLRYANTSQRSGNEQNNLANRILEYFKENIIHTEFNVSDDEEGNVTITVTEKKGEA